MNLIEQKLLPSAIFADSRNFERREVVPRVPKLSELVVKATFASNRHLDPSIKKIDLGSLVYEAQLLRDKTANDPKHREAYKYVLIKNYEWPEIGQHKVIIESKPRLGTESETNELSYKIKCEANPIKRRFLIYLKSKQQMQEIFFATVPHTHPKNKPPSPSDIGHILADESVIINAKTSVFAITTDINYLIFRGVHTPKLDKNEVSEFIHKWNGELNKVNSKYDKDLKKEYDARLNGGFLKSDQEWNGLDAVYQQEVLNEIIREYSLIAFTGRADSRIVKRVTG